MALYNIYPEGHLESCRTISKEHGAHYPQSVSTPEAFIEARIVAQHIQEAFPEIKSVVDIGCAGGHFVKAWLESRKGLALGIDAHLDAPPCLGMPILLRDAGMPLDFYPKTDAVMCWDTAEHLPLAKADALIDNIIQFDAPFVFFSAARPGQDGAKGHQNCKAKDFWTKKFTDRGYSVGYGVSQDFQDWKMELKKKVETITQGPSYLYWIWTNESFVAVK